MRIEWALATDDLRTAATGELQAIGRPIDTTWLDEFPYDFDIPVVLCVVSEDDPDGVSDSRLTYEVRNNASRVVALVSHETPVVLNRYGEWPETEPVRCWPTIVLRWPVEAPGFYKVSISLDDQPEPVILGHHVLRGE